ncbi:MAG TPA: DnaJ family domain-containing protein [Oceanobacillus sp.]|nr:DnaJ family domain-containing protein [Oceanobacillus sp.]
MDIIDEIIKDAQRKGEFANLPGQGKPLKLDEDANTPPHMRMAYKILKENDLAPDWIVQGQTLDRTREALLENLRSAARDYRGKLNDALRSAQPEQERQRVEKAWKRKQDMLRDDVKKYNREVLSYNLKVPQGVTHKAVLNIDQELGKLIGR